MNKAEKDLLIIKRDGLLKMKRLVDTVEKLRQVSVTKQPFISTNLHKFVEGLQTNDYNEIQSLLSKATSESIVKFSISTNSGSWGSYKVMVFLPENFDEISHKIRNDYHEVNDLIKSDEKEKDVVKESIDHKKKTEDTNWWKLTHPIYWISRCYLFFKKRWKFFIVLSLIIVGIILIKFYGWKIESLDLSGPKIVPNTK